MHAGAFTAMTVLGAQREAQKMLQKTHQAAVGKAVADVGEHDWDALERAIEELPNLTPEARKEAQDRLMKMRQRG